MSVRVFGLGCLTIAVLAVPASATEQTNGRSTTTGSTSTNGSQALGTSIFDRWGNLLTQPACTSAGGKWNAVTKICQAPGSIQR